MRPLVIVNQLPPRQQGKGADIDRNEPLASVVPIWRSEALVSSIAARSFPQV
jgi:hypothetical protein